jgi:BlaI family transcriptional regulator, penicillinase repressor
MPAAETPLPTSAELEILRVIWERGPSTVREVYKTLEQEREIGYSTVLKFMQIMTEKGSLIRDESVRPQIYRPARPQKQIQQGIVRDLVSRAFGGSAASLAMHALADKKSSAEERRQIRELLDAMDNKNVERKGRR